MPAGTLSLEQKEHIEWNRLIQQIFDDPQQMLFAGKYYQKTCLHFIKQTISDFLIIKSFADPTVDINTILAITIQRILEIFQKNPRVTSLENSQQMIHYFESFLRDLLKKCEKDMYIHVKNRVIFLVDIQDGVESGITTLKESLEPVLNAWGIKNYKINQNYVDSLTDWAHENKSKKYQLLHSKNSTTRNNGHSRTALKVQEKEIQFYLKMPILIALCYTLLVVSSFQFMEYESAMVLTTLGTGIATLLHLAYGKAFNNVDQARKKGLDKDFEEFHHRTIDLTIKKPKPENNFRIEVMPAITRMDGVDYSFYSVSPAHRPEESVSMSKRMLRWLSQSQHAQEKPVQSDMTSPKEFDLVIIDDFHIKFKYKKVTHHAVLDESKLPRDTNEAKAIVSSFKKGLMPRHGNQKPHSIVIASKSDGTFFKITTGYAGRMKSHSEYTDANNANTLFDMYDPRAHHARRRK